MKTLLDAHKALVKAFPGRYVSCDYQIFKHSTSPTYKVYRFYIETLSTAVTPFEHGWSKKFKTVKELIVEVKRVIEEFGIN